MQNITLTDADPFPLNPEAEARLRARWAKLGLVERPPTPEEADDELAADVMSTI